MDGRDINQFGFYFGGRIDRIVDELDLFIIHLPNLSASSVSTIVVITEDENK